MSRVWSGCATASQKASGSARRRRLLETDHASAESSPTGLRDAIVAAVAATDTRRLAALVEQSFTLHDVETAVEEIVAPALRLIGDRWEDGADCIAEEHLLSEVVLERLRTLLGDRRPAVRGTAVLACAPGERHELGLLALAVLLQADGWLTVYLGTRYADRGRRLDRAPHGCRSPLPERR